jgi:hypothetical protein
VRVLQALREQERALQALRELRARRVLVLLPEPEPELVPELVPQPEPVSSPLVSHSRPLQMKTSRRKAAIQ